MDKKGGMGKDDGMAKNIVIVVLVIIICILGGSFYYLLTHQDEILSRCPKSVTCNCAKN